MFFTFWKTQHVGLKNTFTFACMEAYIFRGLNFMKLLSVS
jgi:hypothetical protein